MFSAPLVGICLAPFAILAIYIAWNDKRISNHPKAMALVSRWSEADIDDSDKGMNLDNPPLTPKTGRRYIVTGGTGYVGGHIVLNLLRRGEDPKDIRILDLRPPARRDLLVGPAKDVAFIKVDVTDAQSVLEAFNAPWPEGTGNSEITVFHTVAILRFFERRKTFLPLSTKVNVDATKNVIDASIAIGATILLGTSSNTVALRAQRLLLWPWETEPKYPVQLLTDDESIYPKVHEEFFSNYAYTKRQAEHLLRDADKQPTSKGTLLRTGYLRIGNAVYGPGGEILDHVIRNGGGPTPAYGLISQNCYVENAVLGHLCYEQRLVELAQGSKNPDIGGQGFLIRDPSPPMAGSDLDMFCARVSKNKMSFHPVSPTLLLLLAHVFENYTLFRECLVPPWLKGVFPRLSGDLLNLQPPCFDSAYNVVLDDSRARSSPEKGGLGYNPPFTTLEGFHRTWAEHRERGPLIYQAKGVGWGSAKLATN